MKNQVILLSYLAILNVLSVLSNSPVLETLVNKYEAIVENVELDEKGRMRATKEISTNKQMLIIPTSNVMSSEENYQFKEYFSKSNRHKLVGRLLIERFIGVESYYHAFIESLPNQEQLEDYYHYSDENKEELTKRSLVKFQWNDRRSDYESLVRKIPSNEIPSLLLNWELYNWAHSIVDIYGIAMKKKYFTEVKRLARFATDLNTSEEVVLIPGVNLFNNGPFKSLTGNNLQASLFAYKEHIYLNSDRYIDENEEVFNEIQFLPNVRLFEVSGCFIQGFHHEEMHLNVNSKDWTLKKLNLCKDLDCLPKTKTGPHFVLKYEFNPHLLTYCQIDQLQENDDANTSFKILKTYRKINDSNYMRALAKCVRVIKEFMKNSKKTSIIKDLKDLMANKYNSNKDKAILNFSLSQKKILYNHIKLFNNRLIKEFQNEIFVNLKKKYAY